MHLKHSPERQFWRKKSGTFYFPAKFQPLKIDDWPSHVAMRSTDPSRVHTAAVQGFGPYRCGAICPVA
jgi:hypothetical protein